MCEKKNMAPDELEKVTGGSGLDPADYPEIGPALEPVPDSYIKVTVTDGAKGRPCCPYDGQFMEFQDEAPRYGIWAFVCPQCKRYFIKRSGNEWYQRP